jgi:DnaJ family protein C protein 4
VLKLPQNCTTKQIKSAFINLSKKHHPDVNKSKQSHVRFQEISEAYKVLGKPESRRNYDLGLAFPRSHSKTVEHHTNSYYEEFSRNPYHDPSFWANRDRRRDEYYYERSYYGVDGVPRLSNGTIMMFCIFFSLIGVGTQYILITKSFAFRRDELIRKSLEAEKALQETKDNASSNGNVMQLEALKTRLLGRALKETDNK